MTNVGDPAELQGKKLIDPSGAEIGEVQEIYLGHESDRPEFALVSTGLFGRKSTMVPLSGASLDGPRIWVDVEKDQVADAPQTDPEAELSAEQEAAIYSHYGISRSGGEPPAGEAGGAESEAADRPEARPESETRSGEPTTSAPPDQGTTADPASPSAEATPGTQGEGGTEAGLPRLRRYVVTEEVDVRVPVQREEIRVEPPEARTEEAGDDRSNT